MADLVFLGICGSLRRDSRNMGLLRKARELMPEGCRLEIADLAPIPFFNQDIGKPEAVQTYIELAEKADGFVFGCPEYNHSLAPALKNALDWLSREPDMKPVFGKPAAIMGAGGGMGTCRSQEALRLVLDFLNIQALNRPEFFANAFSASFAANGDVVDKELEARIGAMMNSLARWTAALGNAGREQGRKPGKI